MLAIINLDDRKDLEMNQLTNSRPIASIPVGARYRVIDFVISNIVNSKINNVGIYAKEKYRSLTDHLGSGKDWDLSRRKGGLYIFSPEDTKTRSKYPYSPGDIYRFFANIDFIEKCDEEYVLITPGHLICNIDYKKVLNHHKISGNDISIVYKKIDNADESFELATTLQIENESVVDFGINIGTNKDANISIETYVLKRETFINYIYECINKGTYKYFEDFISDNVSKMNVGCYEHKGIVKSINNIKSYFELSKSFLDREVSNELLHSDKRIFTKVKNESPTIYSDTSEVSNSFIATGCKIEGTVKNSIIFRNVHVKENAVVENAVIMQGCVISEDSIVNNVIFDKRVTLSKSKVIKGDENYPVVIEKNSVI
ncbi:MAG: glucose-1-phosphate adenylyltransferase subunit GlgD [Peptostreptococcaceae bacterium]